MGLQGTFSTATLALNAQAQHLSNIATNIANVQTNAYKVQTTNFKTLLNHVSGTNKSFFAVNTDDNRLVDKQGLLLTTQRQLDLAIDGRGLFVTNVQPDGSGDWQFTRDGGFAGRSVQFETDTDGDGINDQGSVLTTIAGNTVFGWPANPDGTFNEVNDLNALEAVTINSNQVFDSRATSLITLQANVSAESQGRQGVGLPFIDANGDSRTLTIGFNASTTNEFTLDASSISTGNQPITATIDPPIAAFSGDARMAVPADGLFTVTINDPSGPQVITLDLRQTTQFQSTGSVEVLNLEQDGLQEGLLRSTTFDSDGVLYGSFSNGSRVPLFKLPIANFPAPNNLEAVQGNFFKADPQAGELELRSLGSVSGIAQIVVGALEQSNVDLADQFTKMIVTQRAYSSSATVLRTADEMTQQARDLKR
ncbi:MAG: flagellar hook-basal body complex protein [Alphaproteobacteria bacterium]|nr:flagellar hook-basal body complex protein [Alphaproteobacteria bacterium]